ncbi:MAG: SRPBCC family protein [Actinomycetota bacterium]|nr:SRPBCC family protein [Actinomycetota bacterium]
MQARIDIGRPAGEVFDFVADQTNAPRWQDGLHEVRRITPGPVGVGTEHVFARRFAGMNIESRNRFTAYEPGRFVSFEIPSGKITGEASYLVEPSGASTSQLISEVHFRVSGLAGLATPVLARVFERDSRKNLATVKDLLEHGD